ncbi:alpha/beta hydrolase [Chloroflexota bacterium]
MYRGRLAVKRSGVRIPSAPPRKLTQLILFQPNLPLISPLFGDLQGLPPIYINSGEDDELFEDGERFFLKAKKAGVDITFKAGKGMVHCYPLLAPIFKEAIEAMQEICAFINEQI